MIHLEQLIPSNETWITYIYAEVLRESSAGLQTFRIPAVLTTQSRQLGWIDSHESAGPFILFPSDLLSIDAIGIGIDALEINLSGWSFRDWEVPPLETLPQPSIKWKPNTFRTIDTNNQGASAAGVTTFVAGIPNVKFILLGYEIMLAGNAKAAVNSNFQVWFHDGVVNFLEVFRAFLPTVFTAGSPLTYSTGWIPVELPIVTGRGFGVNLSDAITATGNDPLMVVYQLAAIPATLKTAQVRPPLSQG